MKEKYNLPFYCVFHTIYTVYFIVSYTYNNIGNGIYTLIRVKKNNNS